MSNRDLIYEFNNKIFKRKMILILYSLSFLILIQHQGHLYFHIYYKTRAIFAKNFLLLSN